MTNEELILKRLENIETQITPLIKTADKLNELREDMIPLSNQAVQLLINELQDVEAGFELDDLFHLVKQLLRSTRSIIFGLKQMVGFVEFMKDIEPLFKQAVPQMINYLDDLEQRGVLRIIQAMMGVRAKVAAAYTPEDIDQIGDGMVSLLGLGKKLTDPKLLTFLEKAVEIPAAVDLSASKKVGPWGLVSASSNDEVKEGLGVLIELTKALSKLKENGDIAASVEEQGSVEQK
ncbi:MAG: DUF1641 domain-containing protein [Deltaproteobacteria bacterium]|nr:DUF1641 domain-containing protein [Deltaproteobacteria bacterium]MBW1746923.1 DUF1641 domain-containing protein [Deltaproteobacteria bacterium]MBW2196705.1 DUF1641 domain-containing protein [Deltaproteobacteria bacterium]MBW2226818.1 DUF1641 domain-containing protein [Deltaproteobacteria bacterium]MBW2324958.1 DUF1641 domain-containing protein [Deltaproteobacteria bacterium]